MAAVTADTGHAAVTARAQPAGDGPPGFWWGTDSWPVSVPGSASKPTLVSMGERLEQRDGGVATLRPIDPAAAASWVKGYLVYEEASLSQVVADLGRYGSRKIVVQGPESSLRQFSGILKIDSEDAMLDRLGQLLPLSIDRAGDGPVTVRVASPAK